MLKLEKSKSVLILDLPEAIDILKALTSEQRCKILEAVKNGPMKISELAEEIGLNQSTVSQYVQMLEKVGLLTSQSAPGIQGQAKLVQRTYETILLRLPAPGEEKSEEEFVVEMPIGLYRDIQVKPTCGFATEHQIVLPVDTASTFLDPQRTEAQLLYFADGYVEYAFACGLSDGYAPQMLEISAELCSEYKGYRMDYPSEVTVWINGVEIGTILLPGDFGDRYGKYTPDWIARSSTKYGIRCAWQIDEHGCFVNQKPGATSGTIDDLKLNLDQPIIVRFGFKDDAKYRGGMNLFGPKFGDFDQGIRMRLVGKRKRQSVEQFRRKILEAIK